MVKFNYPFTAVIGQHLMKRAVLLSIIDSNLSSVLLRGFKGTGKSTIVSSLVDIVPDIEVISGCRYNCDPRDRTTMCPDCMERENSGGFDTEIIPMPVLNLARFPDILSKRKKTLESWSEDFRILATANRGIVVMEKANIYDGRTVEAMLNSANAGFNVKNKSAPVRFTFIATVNLEDGDLSPEIIEMFTFNVNVTDITDIEERIEITKRAIEFRKNPELFVKRFAAEQDRLRKRLTKAREDLGTVECPPKIQNLITDMCGSFRLKKIESIIKTASVANAAYDGKRYVSADDIKNVLDITIAGKV